MNIFLSLCACFFVLHIILRKENVSADGNGETGEYTKIGGKHGIQELHTQLQTALRLVHL